MNRKDIKNAYDRVVPDTEAKNRMLTAILEKQTKPDDGKYYSAPQTSPAKWWKLVPAAVLLSCAVVIIALSGNSSEPFFDEVLYDPTEQTVLSENTEIDLTDWQIVEETTYYRIQEKNSLFSYTIMDKNGNPVRTESDLTHYPGISILDQGLIRVITQGGTEIGTLAAYYYDVERNQFSDIFPSITDEIGFLVAYVETDKVVVRNIFDDDYYQEITQFGSAFSLTANPIISVKFVYVPNEEDIHVRVIYLSGEEYKEVREIFRLDDEANLLGGLVYDFNPSEYDTVLGLYMKAIEEGWGPEACSEANISIRIGLPEYYAVPGYLLLDINADGVQELIISDGDVIYDLYTVIDGEAVRLITSAERYFYRLCEGYVVSYEGARSASSTVYEYISWAGNEMLLSFECILFDQSQEADSPWFRRQFRYGTEKEYFASITEDEAMKIMASYVPITMEVTSFFGEPYNQYLVSEYGSSEVEHVFSDLDGNGIEEMLVYNYGAVNDVVTIIEGKAESILSGYELLPGTDGMIGDYAEKSDGCTVTIYKIENQKTEKIECVVYLNSTGLWYRSPDFSGNTATLQSISEDEWKEILSKYSCMEYIHDAVYAAK